MAIPYADATGQLNLFTDALEPVAGTAQSAAEAVADLAGAMTDYSPAAQEVINQQKELNAAMEAAAAAVEELSKAHKEGAIDAETLARAQSRLEQATHAAGHAQEEHHGILEKMADGLSQITGLSESAAHSILGFATELLGVKLAGDALEFVLGHLTAIAEESMEAAARFERLSEAMTLMYGSANEASAALEATEEAANRLAVGIEDARKMAQEMAVFGDKGGEVIEHAMTAAADAAAVTGKRFEETSHAMLRIAETGMASGRILRQLGIETKDLAAVMGVSMSQVQTAMRTLDFETRLQVEEAALKKFGGAAEKVADDTTGTSIRWANAWEKFSTDYGE